MKGKIFSVLLTLCLLFTMLPMTVFAAENEKEFSFVVYDEETGESISGAEATITILHEDGTYGEVYTCKEAEVTVEGYTYSKYTIMVDVATLADSDYFMLKWVCEGYEPIIDDAKLILEDDYYSTLGPVWYWKECEYSAEEYYIPACAWDDGVRAWNEYYEVYESEDGIAVDYTGVWDEAKFMDALAYVREEETITRLWLGEGIFASNGVPGLSANAMSMATKDSPFMAYWFDIDNYGFASFDTITGSEAFSIDLTKEINANVQKRFDEENIKTNALTLNITGDAKFTGTYIEIDMSSEFADVFSIPEENIKETEFGEEGYVYVHIERYNAMKNDFDSCGFGTIYYETSTEFADGKPSYTLIIEPYQPEVGEIHDQITESGSYVIMDAELPLHMYFGENVVVDDVTASMTTEEVTDSVTEAIENAEEGKKVEVKLPQAMNIGADAMEKAKDTETPIVVAVEKTENNSYVNWSFSVIDNPVEFNPSVKVDASVGAVDTKLAEVTLPATTKLTTVSFAHEGDLPGDASVTLDIKNSKLGITDTADGTVVYLYYYNPATNLFELIDESAVMDGYATFRMEHCSDYVITSEKLPKAATTVVDEPENNPENSPEGKPDVPQTGDVTTAGVYMLLLVVGAALLYVNKKQFVK